MLLIDMISHHAIAATQL